jgi:hypothetical protein
MNVADSADRGIGTIAFYYQPYYLSYFAMQPDRFGVIYYRTVFG